eukprot:TRINITY_DN1555_c0_g1_i1.p1 TRINITY_DN1555_c0_g1~~TRINITY_DN1555_c0_g1_i1.p1  ORF type:complete len:451 (+),score=65.35 TRINITY_DN1555_c0_g1_i1:158-1510(+)
MCIRDRYQRRVHGNKTFFKQKFKFFFLITNQMEDDNLPDYGSEEEQNEEVVDKKNYQGINQAGYAGIHSTGFKDFLLKEELNRAITDCGFECPSEVQQECIPNAVLGQDVLCQAKSGMGKTAVFVLAILHQLPKVPDPFSCLVLCHTRELAYQINNEFKRLGKYLQQIKTRVIYGGEPVEKQTRDLKDNPPQVIVGTPGRTLDLIQRKILVLENLKFFVLDECDKMLEQLDMRGDVQTIFKKTPHNKQVMMFSATMSPAIRQVCRKFMQKQVEIFIDDESKLTLHGLLQYYVWIQENEKNRRLNDLLDALLFNQVIIFVKTVQRAVHLNKLLNDCGFPAIAIHAGLSQEERINMYKQFKNFEKRIMVATDVFGRGIDVERVNIVINYDMPENSDSYLHRVGRAGRFGTKGLAITFVAAEEEKKTLKEIQDRFVVQIDVLPETIDTRQYMN